jgi:hypothetical protein
MPVRCVPKKNPNPPQRSQNTNTEQALAATGVIWARYATQITPINYNLMFVNFFVGSTGIYQLWRIWDYRKKNPQVAAT